MITDKELDDIQDSLRYLVRDYPTQVSHWNTACERWRKDRQHTPAFEKFRTQIKDRVARAKKYGRTRC